MPFTILNTCEVWDVREKSTGKLWEAEPPNPEIDNKIIIIDEDMYCQGALTREEFDARFEVIRPRLQVDGILTD